MKSAAGLRPNRRQQSHARRGLGLNQQHKAVRVSAYVKCFVVVVAVQANSVAVIAADVHCVVVGDSAQKNTLGGISELVLLGERRLEDLVVGVLLRSRQVCGTFLALLCGATLGKEILQHNLMLTLLVIGGGTLCGGNATLYHKAF